MQLLVDVGNSRIKWAYWNGVTFCHEQAANHRGSNFDRFLHQIWRDADKPESVWVANVAGSEIEEALSSWVGTIWEQEPVFLTTQTHAFGVMNGYQNPTQLGLDRWLGIVAAFNQCGKEKPVCIIDCGTSLTLDVVSADGQHLGGLLLPGVHTMRQALSDFTDGCKFQDQSAGLKTDLLAQNTQEAMIGGTLFAAVAYVDRFLDEMELELKQPLEICMTGGEAELLSNLMDRQVHVRPNLVLEGLAHYANQSQFRQTVPDLVTNHPIM